MYRFDAVYHCTNPIYRFVFCLFILVFLCSSFLSLCVSFSLSLSFYPRPLRCFAMHSDWLYLPCVCVVCVCVQFERNLRHPLVSYGVRRRNWKRSDKKEDEAVDDRAPIEFYLHDIWLHYLWSFATTAIFKIDNEWQAKGTSAFLCTILYRMHFSFSSFFLFFLFEIHLLFDVLYAAKCIVCYAPLSFRRNAHTHAQHSNYQQQTKQIIINILSFDLEITLPFSLDRFDSIDFEKETRKKTRKRFRFFWSPHPCPIVASWTWGQFNVLPSPLLSLLLFHFSSSLSLSSPRPMAIACGLISTTIKKNERTFVVLFAFGVFNGISFGKSVCPNRCYQIDCGHSDSSLPLQHVPPVN